MAAQLENRPITEKPKQLGVKVDGKLLGQTLRVAAEQLEEALADVRREERELQLTQKRRNETMATWNARYPGVADVATGLFELAGRGDLADLVRPTARRRAGLTEEGDVVEEGGTEAAPAITPDATKKKPG